jgi:Gpi18-like mannosyltransferase
MFFYLSKGIKGIKICIMFTDNSIIAALNGAPFILICCLIFIWLCYVLQKKISVGGNNNGQDFSVCPRSIIITFGAAFILRILLAVLYEGHEDVSYFRYWTSWLSNNSPFDYYDELSTNNTYLPGYLYIMFILGKILNFSGLPYNYAYIKLPSVICDLITALVIFKAVKKYSNPKTGYLASILYLFNPAIFLNSALWGQVDSFTALFTILSLYFILEKRYVLSYIFAGIGLAFKLQFAFVLPVLGIFTMKEIYTYIKKKQYKELLNILYAFFAAAGAFTVIVLPFTIKYMVEGDIFFILKVYFGQTGMFNDFALNTFNIYSMIMKNWVELPSAAVSGLISWDAFNYIIIGLLSVCASFLVVVSKKKRIIYLASGFLIIAIFIFCVKMHERYMYAALAPLLIAACISKNKGVFAAFMVFSVLHFLNTGVLLFKSPRYFYTDDLFLIIFSGITVLFFISFTVIAVFEAVKAGKQDLKAETKAEILCQEISEDNPDCGCDIAVLSGEEKRARSIKESIDYYNKRYEKNLKIREETKLGKKDAIICVIFFLIYFALNLINLGGTNVPQTYWEVKQGDYIILEIPDGVTVGEIWGYKGIDIKDNPLNCINVYAGDSIDADNYGAFITEANYKGKKNICNNGNSETSAASMYKWFEIIALNESCRYIAFSASEGTRINEIVPLEKDTREIIDYRFVCFWRSGEKAVTAAFDERNTYPGYNSLMTDMYFDEIYHARTAFEHINGWEPYEITHPPLGKIIISLGIRVFGMNPLGWRISGVIFSCALVPLMYILGKMLFEKRLWGMLFALLSALDGLHFVQGRIATIDTYPVFFSTLSMLFMLIFFRTNILRENTIKCLIPFALSGLFFGFAVASKWTGLYTGAGLLVLLIIYIYRMLDEYRNNAALLENEENKYKSYSKAFDWKLSYIMLIGAVFFIIIPFMIYLASYIPYMTGEKSLGELFKIMVDNQVYMYNYHSVWVVGTTHQCQSPWYSWFFNYRSVYMYYADSSFNAYARIHSLGNHIINWGGLAALIFCIYTALKKQIYAILNLLDISKKEELKEKYIKKKKGFREGFESKFKTRIYEKLSIENKDTLIFIFIGFLSAILPWAFVERSTFIYHFYPSMPYYIGMIIFTLMYICRIKSKKIGAIKIFGKNITVTGGGMITAVYIFAAVVMFILLFPVYTGIPINRVLADILYSWVRALGGHVGL